MRETDIINVRKLAKGMLNLPLEAVGEGLFLFVSHPFTNTCMISYKDGDHIVFGNLLEDKEAYQKWHDDIEEMIEKADLQRIFFMLDKRYLLTFLKFSEKYLSKEDFSSFLADSWVRAENPNKDLNVNHSTLIRWFRGAKKDSLMDEEEFAVYNELPDEITVYRGVGIGRSEKGLSWTQDRDTAEWFAHRFDRGGQEGYLLEGTIRKEDVLAYFNGRNEEEVVLDYRKVVLSENHEAERI